MSTQPEKSAPAPKDEHGSSGGGRRHKKHKGGGHEDAPLAHDESNWLVSYADMMTLLFGFFVLMYSFSRIDEKKFEIIRKDVARYFGGQVKVSPTLKKIEEEAKDIIVNAGMDKAVELVAKSAEIELRFNSAFHFRAGTADLTPNSAHVLNKLIDMLKRNIRADAVTVEGHTDDEPIFSAKFPSNWELSSGRASAVVREFEKFGFDPSKLTATGFGSSRPLVPNRDSKGSPIVTNQESNRRVIVTVGFSREMEAAVSAMKTNQFISADANEQDQVKDKSALVRPGEGEQTWKEKMEREMGAVQEKLSLAEERYKETSERSRAAKQLADMQNKLKEVEKNIAVTEVEIKKYQIDPNAQRAPASKVKRGVKKTTGKKPVKKAAGAKADPTAPPAVDPAGATPQKN